MAKQVNEGQQGHSFNLQFVTKAEVSGTTFYNS